ncbi:MAG: energy transducer TonB [bacterium]
MSNRQKKKNFIKLPRYTGGTEAFRKYISENLRYPEAALEAGVEGSVIVEYDILDDGLVQNARVLKGLDYSCDEEALRLIGSLRFEKVKNRGLRVKMTTKTKINFILPKTGITYTVTGKKETGKEQKGQEPDHNPPVTYEYTIRF